MKMDRREFVKLSALTAASAVAGLRAGAAPATTATVSTSADGVSWNKAPCRFCGTGCHVRVGVKAGRVVGIEGDQLAEVNKGLLCVKGYHVGLALYGKDRLTTPQLRKNGKLEPVSWEEAIEVIAKRIMAAPDKFALYGSGQWTIGEGCAGNKFMKAGLGSNQIDGNPRLCMSSAVTGYLSTYGVDEPAGCYDDLDRCACSGRVTSPRPAPTCSTSSPSRASASSPTSAWVGSHRPARSGSTPKENKRRRTSPAASCAKRGSCFTR